MKWNHATSAELMEEEWTRLPISAIAVVWDLSDTEWPAAIIMFDDGTSSSYDSHSYHREFKP
jgi:hypothetical protein